jgi:transcription elongation factor Elf1
MNKQNTNTERHWFTCPCCGQKICQFADGAMSLQVFIKCKKCGNEIELRINISHEVEEHEQGNEAAAS